MEYPSTRQHMLQRALRQRESIGSFECFAEPHLSEIEEALKDLKSRNERTAQIVEMYYCFAHQEVVTQEQIGKHFNVSSQRIHQICQNGVRILRGYVTRKLQLLEHVRSNDSEYTAPLKEIAALKGELSALKAQVARSGQGLAAETLRLRISDLDMSVRTNNSLDIMGVTLVSELVTYTPSALLRIPGFGRRSVNEVVEKLREKGLELEGE